MFFILNFCNFWLQKMFAKISNENSLQIGLILHHGPSVTAVLAYFLSSFGSMKIDTINPIPTITSTIFQSSLPNEIFNKG